MTREQGTGNREEVLGDFTFRYIFRFFSVHLLVLSQPKRDSIDEKHYAATGFLDFLAT
jgi:hypothetical protein